MATANHSWGTSMPQPFPPIVVPVVYVPPASSEDKLRTIPSTSLVPSPVSLPPGPPKNKAALVAQFGSKAEYSAALVAAKRERRKRRSAEAVLVKKAFFASEHLSVDDFKAECQAVLDNLRAMPYGIPKTPEQLNLELAQFAERWFRRGQQYPVLGASERVEMVTTPQVEIIPAGSMSSAVMPAIPDAQRHGGRAADPASIAGMEFTLAASVWLQTRRVRLKASTCKAYMQCIKMLSVYFKGMKLHEIHNGHLLEYQACRTENVGGDWFVGTGELPTPWENRSGASNTNHELNTLSQILRMAKLWGNLVDDYKPLSPKGFKKPKVMTDDEKRRFYTIASSKPDYLLALWVAVISNNTSATGVELRNLTFGDVFLECETPYIQINPETAKCRNRGRESTLNPDALWAIKMVMDRARRLGAHRDEHYIFPYAVRRNLYDVTRPASSCWLRRPWEGLRREAELPWLTPHKLRHQCLTELMEADVPAEVIRKIAGHLSPEMTEHYTHLRRERQAEALNRLKPLSDVLRSKQ